jgi:hypothetical protein
VVVATWLLDRQRCHPIISGMSQALIIDSPFPCIIKKIDIRAVKSVYAKGNMNLNTSGRGDRSIKYIFYYIMHYKF